MKCRPAAVAAAAALLLASGPARSVSGRVFLDTNGNGRWDSGEPALAGVGVTDGVGFVRTNGQGRYTIKPRLHELLHPATECILTVSFPSGSWPVGPWFRRVGAKATGEVDFPLRKDVQKLPFVFVHGTG